MNRFISSADGVLRALGGDLWFSFPRAEDRYNQTEILKVELKLVRTFLIYVSSWGDAHQVFPELGSLLRDIEAAFNKATRELGRAPTAISELQEKITLLRPQVKAAYDAIISHNNNNNNSSYSIHPMSNYHLWMAFAHSLEGNLWELCYREDELLDSVVTQLRSMEEMIGSLRLFLHGHPSHLFEYLYLLTHFGAVLVWAARISYSCWVDRTTSDDESITFGQNELVHLLYDLLKEFKPNTREVVHQCLKLLKKSSSSMWDEKLVKFLIPDKYGVRTLRYGLKNLILFVTHWHKEDDVYVKLLLKDIVSAISELGCFGYMFHVNETDPALVKLLEKVELLKAELFLMELLNLQNNMGPLVKNRINSFHKVLSFLPTFVGDAFWENSRAPKPIWMDIEPLVREAGSVYCSFDVKLINKDKATDELRKLVDQIKLFKMELLLEEELLNRNSSFLIVNVKNQIETVYEELILLRTFRLGPLEVNGKLTFKAIESLARYVASNYHFFRATQIMGDTAGIFSHLVTELVEKIKPVSAEIKKIYLQVRSSSQAKLPKTDGFGFIHFLVENMRELLNSNALFIAPVRHQIQVIHKEIEFVRSFSRNIKEQYKEHSDLENLVSACILVAREAEYLIDSFLVGDVLWYHMLWLSDLIEDIKLIKIKASEITKNKRGISIHDVPQFSIKAISPDKIPKTDEIVIDLADQTQLMINMLTRGSLQQDVVSIVGMPGLGKTTLAKKVYNDPLVTYHFHIRAWCSVSQVYRKRELLLELLGDIVDLTENILEMSDEDLDMELYQCLKRKRYLIVMDDLWSIDAWNDLNRSFPNDGNGSRILITSRLIDVASRTKADSIPHFLRLLSDDESWTLLQKRLFQTKDCPDELVSVGKQIAKSCKGLPLGIVAVSGIVERTEMKPDCWKQVAETLSSHIVNNPERMCMDILELSYQHLPSYLKPCFLYLGAFVEDKEIPVWKLTCLWIAEGFIQTTGPKSVEDIAEEYLRDLVGRSLVIASKRRSNGGVKTCRVHDMLRTLCLIKCEEDAFLEWNKGCDDISCSCEDLDYGVDPHYCYPTNAIKYERHRLCICSKRNHFVMSRASGPHVHSLLYFASSDLYPRCPYDISFIFDNFKLLRVLDLESINMGNFFPSGVELLVHLRFLALCGDIDSIPVSINKLRNLETLIVKGLKGRVLIPNTIWSMTKLRHLHVNNYAAFSLQDGERKISHQLDNLVSFSSPSLFCGQNTENIMRRLPKLRKLKCVFSESRDDVVNCNQFPVLDFLIDLESLKVLYAGRALYSGRIAHPCNFAFPLKLKKLSLSKFRLPWDCISEIGRLPNLEVLKLLSRSFDGKVWEMKDGEFLKLKFLKLDTLNIVQWNASCDNFPKLQHLTLRNCRQLEEVPSAFADIPTLEIIEVQLCRRSAEESVRRLKKEQIEMGNDELKVLINRSDWDF